MFHANVRCTGKCSLGHKFAFVFIFTFGFIYLMWIAFQWPSSYSRISPALQLHIPPTTLPTIKCQPKTNIFFLKTHKCASSTVQNVFLRFGSNRGLTFVLPTLGNYLGNQGPFHRSMAMFSPWHSLGYNIFCHHTVFNKPEIGSIMPTDTFYVTIVRHPVTLFESLYEYADLALRYRQTFEQFVFGRKAGSALNKDRAQGYLGVNQMAYDMGIRPDLFANQSAIDDQIERLRNEFHLVLLAEHFDQSMVLLADKLCWDLDDVTYFKHNTRKSKLSQMNRTMREKIERLNSADMKIYQAFERLFERQIEAYGGWNKMEDAVQQLRMRNEEFNRFCSKSHFTKKRVFAFLSNKVESLSVDSANVTCQDMSRNEIEFTKKLKMTQMMKVSRKYGSTGFVRKTGTPVFPMMWHQLSKEMGFRPLITHKSTTP